MRYDAMDLKHNSWSREHTPSILAKSMFYYLQSAGYFSCGPGYATRRAQYNSMLLLYTTSGHGILQYRGLSYDLAPGSLFLIDCMEEQMYATGDGGVWIFDFVHFNGSESRGYVSRILGSGGPVYSIPEDSFIPKRVKALHMLLREGEEHADARASCLIVELLTELLLFSGRSGPDLGITPKPIRDAVGLLEAEFGRPIDLDTLAKRLCISKFHLSRLFKHHTGYSPYEYLIKCRMNHGKMLLKTTELPVHEVARRAGFESPSHFIKSFKGLEGVTPLKFRKFWR